MKIVIKNAWILTMNEGMEQFRHGYLVADENIIEVGPMNSFPMGLIYDQCIDAKGAILLPGMVNTHTHIGMIPFRSLGDDYPDRLRRFLFPLENECMNEQLAYTSGKYAIAEMQLAGVTTFFDMYYFEHQLALAAEEMQARALLAETVIDSVTVDVPEPMGGLQYAERFLPKWQGNKKIQASIAPHAPYSNTIEVIQQADILSKKYNVPWMMHVSEMDFEMETFRKERGQTPIEFLEDIGVLSSRLVAAHCIHLTDHDIELLQKYDVKVAHCIGANTKSAKGVARVRDLMSAGVKVGLGTDGPSSGNTLDIFSQMRLFANFHKTHLQDRSAFPAKAIVKLATIEGAKVLGLEEQIGSIEAGKQADFILVETDSVNMFPIYDPYSALVYSSNASNVSDVFIAGKQVVAGKKLVNHDVTALRAELSKAMEQCGFKRRALQAMAEI
ncbi:amidohydrolase [Bacillus sp. DTU_2020_1000418_1_SI_GHA_SEK_038]|uniref:amidohydrolase n=1 Tax=Bacillus sp. DTU_2020_1000418_1_SI_GHA_SEK_038 TaxID=3077585 RepID=UPI0028E730BB|nr:amidohydrolase [Bacillus sp. DTU_2020_1000418_1_SI_GHA_SEK_038]WNS75454.1 amidohydrolase [Bacillus sp. DTU_2020_1000418_1_SI_GHA_SEK_038]